MRLLHPLTYRAPLLLGHRRTMHAKTSETLHGPFAFFAASPGLDSPGIPENA
jgi:hypothetical protein